MKGVRLYRTGPRGYLMHSTPEISVPPNPPAAPQYVRANLAQRRRRHTRYLHILKTLNPPTFVGLIRTTEPSPKYVRHSNVLKLIAKNLPLHAYRDPYASRMFLNTFVESIIDLDLVAFIEQKVQRREVL